MADKGKAKFVIKVHVYHEAARAHREGQDTSPSL